MYHNYSILWYRHGDRAGYKATNNTKWDDGSHYWQKADYLFFCKIVQFLFYGPVSLSEVAVSFAKVLEPGLLLGVLEIFGQSLVLFLQPVNELLHLL